MPPPKAPVARAANDWRRTHTCGELRATDVGAAVVLNGWVHARRDHGGIYFVDLRDRYGRTQVVLSEAVAAGIKLGPEDVICVRGEVAARGAQNRNPHLPTGDIEVVATGVTTLSSSLVPPRLTDRRGHNEAGPASLHDRRPPKDCPVAHEGVYMPERRLGARACRRYRGPGG